MIGLVTSLLGTVISSISAILMFSAFSQKRKNGKDFWVIWTVCAFIRVPLAYAMAGENGILRLAIGFIPLLLMYYFLYIGTTFLKLFVAVVYYSWAICIDNFVFSAMFTFAQKHDWYFFGKLSNFILSMLIQALILLFCVFVEQIHPYQAKNNMDSAGMMVSMSISLLSIAMTAVLGDGYKNHQISQGLLLFCAMFSSCVNVSVFYLISWLEQAAYLKEENLTLQSQIKAQKDGIEALGNSYAEQRKLTHDFNAHINALQNYLVNGKIDEAKRYTTRLKEQQTERILLVRTHNSTVDAILNQKGYVAKKHEIDIRFAVNDLSKIFIDPMDLTIVMNNLLDNAIEACQKMPQETRSIYVKMILKDTLFLSVRNNSHPVVIRDNMIPTTKIPPDMHGYGLQNVKTILKKYDAFFTMQYADGYFSFAAEIEKTLRS